MVEFWQSMGTQLKLMIVNSAYVHTHLRMYVCIYCIYIAIVTIYYKAIAIYVKTCIDSWSHKIAGRNPT